MSSDASSKSASDRSLRSHGAIDPIELPKKKKRKPAAIWTSEEETVLVDFLLSEFSASGDGNPKGSTFTAAASLLGKDRFPNSTGAEKTGGVCGTKWQSVRYHVANDQGKLKESMFCSSNRHIMLS
jgi:hypothetical protein